MRTVNVGVIGVGAMGYNHARVYYKLEEAEKEAELKELRYSSKDVLKALKDAVKEPQDV